MNNILTEAFKNLNLLEQDFFDVDEEGIKKLDEFEDNMENNVDETVNVVDLEAEDEEELKDDYVGKVITRCVVCHTDVMRNEDELKKVDGQELVNIDDECPICQSMEGFKILGVVAPYIEKAEEEVTEVKDEEDKEEKIEEKKVCPKCGNNPCKCKQLTEKTDAEKIMNALGLKKEKVEDNKNIEKTNKRMTEDIDEVDVISDGDKVKVFKDEDGTVIKLGDDVDEEEKDEEVIVPLNDEEKEEIEDKLDAKNEEDEDEEEIDIDEFDENEFDTLGEGFLKKVYSNVDGYKTSAGYIKDNKLKLEGVITFKSGKKANTTFMFESVCKTKSGKLKLIGENAQFTNGKKAFTLTATTDGKKLIAESLNYRYSVKDANGASRRLNGSIKK